jgi:hypothetical protein
LNTLIHINQDGQPGGEETLLLELGNEYCGYAFLSPDRKNITQLRYFSFDPFQAEEGLRTALEGITQEPASVFICTAYPQALLVPQHLFKPGDHTLLDAVYDVPAQHYRHDSIGEWQMVNLYGLPASVQQTLSGKFPSAQFFHAYTTSLKAGNGIEAENQLRVHFNPREFRVMVKKGAQVFLAQTYQYSTPLDVVYYLLKIGSEFGLDQSEVAVVLSGLVEAESPLYKEVQQYYSNICFPGAPSFQVPDSPHPPYYFHSLFNLAACVS